MLEMDFRGQGGGVKSPADGCYGVQARGEQLGLGGG